MLFRSRNPKDPVAIGKPSPSSLENAMDAIIITSDTLKTLEKWDEKYLGSSSSSSSSSSQASSSVSNRIDGSNDSIDAKVEKEIEKWDKGLRQLPPSS